MSERYSDQALVHIGRLVSGEIAISNKCLEICKKEDNVENIGRYEDTIKICKLFLDFIYNELDKNEKDVNDFVENDKEEEFTENIKRIGKQVYAQTQKGDWVEIGEIVAIEKKKE